MDRYTKFMTLILVVIALVLYFKLADAGERRSYRVYNDGTHITLLDPGECDESGCVMYEKYIEQWNGIKWVHQFVDNNHDDVCDVIIIWKPLEDPEYGIYYGTYSTGPCGGAI